MNAYCNQSADTKRQQRLLFLLFVYVFFLIVMTLSPFDFSLSHMKKWKYYDYSVILGFLVCFKSFDIFSNILLFIPFGGFLDSWYRETKRKKSLFVPMLFGGLLSFSIEFIQLFLSRSANVVDVLANMAGATLGFIGLWQWLNCRFFSRVARWLRAHPIWRPVVIGIYLIGLAYLMMLAPRKNHLKNWDETYSLLIGNEATLNRPWEGKVFQTVVYQRALSDRAIRNLYALGPQESDVQMRNGLGSIVHYNFNKGIAESIPDLSANAGSLPLIGKDLILDKENRGIHFQKGQCLKSIEPAKQLTQAIEETGQFSVEVWLQTDRLDQTGPARIVTLSKNPSLRNFTLGQQRQDVHFRVRTPLAGMNGSRINLVARSVFHDRDTHHLIATFNHGVEKLFVDGKVQKDVLRSNWDYLPFYLNLNRDLIGKLVLCFVVFFPLSLLFYGLFQNQRIPWTIGFIGVVVIVIEMIDLVLFGQPVYVTIVVASLVTAGLGALVGWYWDSLTVNE